MRSAESQCGAPESAAPQPAFVTGRTPLTRLRPARADVPGAGTGWAGSGWTGEVCTGGVSTRTAGASGMQITNVLPSPNQLRAVMDPPINSRQLLADRQPEAATRGRTAVASGRRAVDLAEGLEHRLQILFPDPDPGVAHLELHVRASALAIGSGRSDDKAHAALVGVLQGVVEQVAEDLEQPAWVADHSSRHPRIQVPFERRCQPRGRAARRRLRRRPPWRGGRTSWRPARSCPASIREKSRIPSTSVLSSSPERCIFSRARAGGRPRGVSSRISAVASTVVNGVRISWLMLARNIDFGTRGLQGRVAGHLEVSMCALLGAQQPCGAHEERA